MERRDELISYLCKTEEDRQIIVPIIDELLFVECRMADLKKLPFIKIHPDFPELQKATPAAKQYKELLQQYTNLIKVLEKSRGSNADDIESPLRKWVRLNADSRTQNLDAG